jgi:hypothetical protein
LKERGARSADKNKASRSDTVRWLPTGIDFCPPLTSKTWFLESTPLSVLNIEYMESEIMEGSIWSGVFPSSYGVGVPPV